MMHHFTSRSIPAVTAVEGGRQWLPWPRLPQKQRKGVIPATVMGLIQYVDANVTHLGTVNCTVHACAKHIKCGLPARHALSHPAASRPFPAG